MNKVMLMGRLTKDPDVRYTQAAEPLAVVRYTLAVNRRFKRQGEPDADFINCVAFGKTGEFAEKYLRKGQMIGVSGRIQVRSWDDKDGKKQWSTDVVIEDQYFAESKRNEGYSDGGTSSAPAPKSAPANKPADGFYPIDETMEDDDMPF
ncbi:MAG: single-stranded DNA-binding protein [Bacillota bacterium]